MRRDQESNARMVRLITLLLLIAGFMTYVHSQQNTPRPVGPLLDKALKQSQLTLPGSRPFHMKVSVVETTNPTSDRNAQIEMYWISPQIYRRTIESPAFSQTLVVNGDAVSEKNTANYFPYWLYQVVTALFDPLPYADEVKKLNAPVTQSSWGSGGNVCMDAKMRVDRWVICFAPKTELLTWIFSKSYNADFREYQPFGYKQVARRVVTTPEFRSEIHAVITILEPLTTTDESLFAVTNPTPASERIQMQRISENQMFAQLTTSSDIAWPKVLGGKPSGGCGAFVSADRDGNVREEFPEGCDNAALEQPLHDAILKWKMKPTIVDGAPVQVQALLGIPFTVDVTPLPELSDSEARKLALASPEPDFTFSGLASGTNVVVRVSVDDDGKVLGVEVRENRGIASSTAAQVVGEQWKFSPYVLDGKPMPFEANIEFVAP